MKLHQADTHISADGSNGGPSQNVASGQLTRARRRPDPLGAIWTAEVLPMLETTARTRPVTVYEEIRRRHPEIRPGVRRTLERRIRDLG
jgi:hypothetical protein